MNNVTMSIPSPPVSVMNPLIIIEQPAKEPMKQINDTARKPRGRQSASLWFPLKWSFNESGIDYGSVRHDNACFCLGWLGLTADRCPIVPVPLSFWIYVYAKG